VHVETHLNPPKIPQELLGFSVLHGQPVAIVAMPNIIEHFNGQLLTFKVTQLLKFPLGFAYTAVSVSCVHLSGHGADDGKHVPLINSPFCVIQENE
jgi:hypothetical protein